jgi:hypothetical protein
LESIERRMARTDPAPAWQPTSWRDSVGAALEFVESVAAEPV